MIREHIQLAVRHQLKNRLSSLINIVGLTCGITCFLLALIYWKDESSFDNFHKNNPNIWRITTSRLTSNGVEIVTGTTGQVQGPAFKSIIPQIDKYVRVMGGDIQSDIVAHNETFRIRPLFVDPAFFDVFTFTMLHGNPSTALRDVNSVVLTESTARKFFGDINVLGEVLTMDADPSFDRHP